MALLHPKNGRAKQIFTNGFETESGQLIDYGTGSPEGVVTAPIGSSYTDTATGNVYDKKSGVSNTGWIARYTTEQIGISGTVSAVATDTLITGHGVINLYDLADYTGNQLTISAKGSDIQINPFGVQSIDGYFNKLLLDINTITIYKKSATEWGTISVNIPTNSYQGAGMTYNRGDILNWSPNTFTGAANPSIDLFCNTPHTSASLELELGYWNVINKEVAEIVDNNLLNVLDAVYYDPNAGYWKKAIATDQKTCATAIVVAKGSVVLKALIYKIGKPYVATFTGHTATDFDTRWGTSGGLTTGSEYYLSQTTAGALTDQLPTSGIAQVCVVALSSTSFEVRMDKIPLYQANINKTIQTTSFIADIDHNFYSCDGTLTVTLPPRGFCNHEIKIKNVGAGDVTIDGDGTDTIDGSATYTIPGGSKGSVTLIPNLDEWTVN